MTIGSKAMVALNVRSRSCRIEDTERDSSLVYFEPAQPHIDSARIDISTSMQGVVQV